MLKESLITNAVANAHHNIQASAPGEPEGNKFPGDECPVTSSLQDAVKYDIIAYRRLREESQITINASSFGYGKGKTVSPYEAKSVTLNEVNRGCKQLNNHVQRNLDVKPLSDTQQAKLVQTFFSSFKNVLSNPQKDTIEQYVNETQGLGHIDDPTQMSLIVSRTMTESVKHWIVNYCHSLPLQGHFWLSYRYNESFNGNELFLDISSLSMHRLHHLLRLISSQFTQTPKARASLQEEAKSRAEALIDALIAVDLANISNPATLAQFMVDHQSWFTIQELNSSMYEYMQIEHNSQSINAHAWQRLLKARAKSQNLRSAQLLALLEKRNAGPRNTVEYSTYQVFVNQVGAILREMTTYWDYIVKFSDPKRVQLFSLPESQLDDVVRYVSRTFGKARTTPTSSSTALKRARPVERTKFSTSSKGHGTKAEQPSLSEIQESWAPCAKCGGKHKPNAVNPAYCPFEEVNHPHVNKDPYKSWEQSEYYHLYESYPWIQKSSGQPQSRLQYGKVLAKGQYVDYAMKNTSSTLDKPKPQGMIYDVLCNINPNREHSLPNPFMDFIIVSNNFPHRKQKTASKPLDERDREGKPATTIQTTGIIDTGALEASYISISLADKLKTLGYNIDTSVEHFVKGALNNTPRIKCLGSLDFSIKIFNEITRQHDVVSLSGVQVIDSPIEIIVGRPAIREHNLLRKCHDQILLHTKVRNINDPSIPPLNYLENELWLRINIICTLGADNNNMPLESEGSDDTTSSNRRQSDPREWHSLRSQISEREHIIHHEYEYSSHQADDSLNDEGCTIPPANDRSSLLGQISDANRVRRPNPPVKPLPYAVKTGDIIPMGDLLDQASDGFDPTNMINHPDDDPTVGHAHITSNCEEYKQVAVFGNPALQNRIKAILAENREVFSSTLPSQPARVTPLRLDVDAESWETSAHQLPHRRQSISKDVEIFNQVRDMIKSSVVTESTQAHAWSQVLLVLKPNGKWRFCIDFRQLNNLIKDRGWPLPRIDEVLDRVGCQHPKFFGKMDLTNGYHQLPLAMESRKWTAFKTAHGLYEWNRVPMGLRNAAAHFQQCLATEVLQGMVHKDIELYIDDILLYAHTEDQFITSLRQLLQRLKGRGIVLSPTKCSFGMEEVEILGHTINSKGCHFSREKLSGVLEFKLPETGSHLHSFLGLGNYFRKHVRDVARLEKSLRKLVQIYTGSRKIPWQQYPKERQDFLDLKQAIGECPKLFFYDEKMPVCVHTDACNGGIGGYVFQLDPDGQEYPIGFLSKTLHGAELSWSTFEQECFAIHETLNKFEYLLRDVPFTIRTDHKNLLYLNQYASQKVLRWKWDIQQFNFKVEHIPGEENVTADTLSRLCTLMSTSNSQESTLDSQDDSYKSSPLLLAISSSSKLGTPKPWSSQERPIDSHVHELISQVHGWGYRDPQGNITPGMYGHGGVERTLNLLKDIVPPDKWWASMRSDVRNFIHQCPACQFMQSAKLAIHSKRSVHPFNMCVGRPMDRINIDTIGPFPPDENGNKYIMVFIDVFSRFVELTPIPDLSALTAAKEIVKFTGRYGIPDEILTDNGTQYLNTLSTILYDLMYTDHITILPYSHEENSIVERANREVNKHLRSIIFDRKIKTQWSIVLPLVQRVMNTMQHSSIGCAPSQIIFGNAIDLDRGILHDHQSIPKDMTYPEYVLRLLNTQAEVIARAQSIQEIVADRHITQKLKTLRDTTDYIQNDYVLWELPDNMLDKDSREDRLSPHYRGPYRVITSKEGQVEIQNLITNEIHKVLTNHLKPFIYDSNIIDPKTVALHAQNEFFPEEIIDIFGDQNKKTRRYLRTNLQVKVRWAGYSSTWDTWEPYQSLKTSDIFKQYCHCNSLEYLLDSRN